MRGTLTASETLVLKALGDRGTLSTSTLAKLFDDDVPGTSALLRRMAKQGLIGWGERVGIPGGGWEWTWSVPMGAGYELARGQVIAAAWLQYRAHLRAKENRSARLLKEAIQKMEAT